MLKAELKLLRFCTVIVLGKFVLSSQVHGKEEGVLKHLRQINTLFIVIVRSWIFMERIYYLLCRLVAEHDFRLLSFFLWLINNDETFVHAM